MTTMEQMYGNLEAMELKNPPDQEAHLQPDKQLLNYTQDSDANMDDMHLYTAGLPVNQDGTIVGRMMDQITAGQKFCTMIYACRSLSKAIPQVKSHDQPNRMELYQETVNILQPEVDKMKSCMDYNREATTLVLEVISGLATKYVKEKRDLHLIPHSVLITLAKLLSALFVLDNLKNVKSAWNNDFSAYKRAAANLRKMDTQETVTFQELYLFLANNNVVFNSLKTELERVDGYKEILAHLLNKCTDMYDEGLYVSPTERNTLLNTLTFGVPLLDGSVPNDPKADDKVSILRIKRLKLDRIAKIFKRTPVVHLLADMQIATAAYIGMAPHIEAAKWGPDTEEEKLALDSQFEFRGMIEKARTGYKNYIAKLSILTESLRGGEPSEDVMMLLVEGCQLLTTWTCFIKDSHAWKLAHPIDKYQNRDMPETAQQYERCVRYNYLKEERYLMVEIITMIKDLKNRLASTLSYVSPIVRVQVHHDVQKLIHAVIQPLIQQSNKKKRREASQVLAQLYNLSGDLDISVDSSTGSASGKKRKPKTFKLPEGSIVLPTRACPVTQSQLFALREGLMQLLNIESADHKGGLMKEKDFTAQQLSDFNEFYTRSFYFYQILNIDETLVDCSDLSFLWFKEFFLELAKEIQFPVEMSLPWILTEEMLSDPSLAEYVFYPLELYNDSANAALSVFNSQCLFDEIQAEVNLCFDQLIFKMSQSVFTYFKAKATALQTGGDPLPHRAYISMLSQKRVHLLGRFIDTSRMIAQGLNGLLRKTLDYTIGIFESEDITSVMKLENMLENGRMTHALLSEHFELDTFEHILTERNLAMNPASQYGRIEHKITFDLLYDFMPQFCYDSGANEFTRTPLALADEIERDPPPKVSNSLLYGSKSLMHRSQALWDATRGRFTVAHGAAIVRLVGQQKLGALINEMCQNVGLVFHTVVKPYVESLGKAMSKDIKPPDFFYGLEGAFGYYEAHLKPILQYPDLSTEVFQVFRVIGNTLALIQLLEHALDVVDVFDSILSTPFAKCKPDARRVQMPTAEQVARAGKQLGFNIKGGADQNGNSPVVISRVDPGSVAEDVGLTPGDQILVCAGVDFNNPRNLNPPQPITHQEAVGLIQQAAGHELIVRNDRPVTFVEQTKQDIEGLSQAMGTSIFRERLLRAGPLSNSISLTGSVFKGAMETINKLLDSTNLRDEWLGPVPSNGVFNVGTQEFHRLWSAIQFAFCTPTPGNTMNSQTLFGESVQWGGLALVYFLGQAQRFEAMDYVYRVLDIADLDPKPPGTVGTVNLNEFLQLGKFYNGLNQRVFSLFRVHLPEVEDRTKRCGVCQPPSGNGSGPRYEPVQGEHGVTKTN